ncbi:hypothetical protein LY474_18445 [Myxococcus stipitatus]|uniref:hypothetical protein n=1 Tax=Myxococcus stipitatus TaxID=83455 RepID=UPI001F39F6B1|nr:hypothetical protein [Myxococcus stipitatus]MCE9669780.1 hypothetical protein [Myxococcus stipitatus]
MRWNHWCALMGLGLAGCGGAPEAERPSGDDATPRVEARGVETPSLACPPGTASRVKELIAPGAGPVIFSNQFNGMDLLVGTEQALYLGTNFLDGRSVLWRSDGTPDGTVAVKSFAAGRGSVPRLDLLVAVDTKVFFTFDDADTTGNELWVSDGTNAGTHLVRDLEPGSEGSMLWNLTSLNGVLVFLREVRTQQTEPNLFELWRSDGSDLGTWRIATLPRVDGYVRALRLRDTLLLFLASPKEGTLLWRTDGTPHGTGFVRKLDSDTLNVTDALVAEGQGLFVVPDGDQWEVWRTDGSPSGTARMDTYGKPVTLLGGLGRFVYVAVTEPDTNRLHAERLSLGGGGKTRIAMLPNPYASDPDAYPYIERSARLGQRLVFSMAISSSGPAPREVRLWATDGTTAGTRQLPGLLPRSDERPSPLFPTGERMLLFVASRDGMDNEAWFTWGDAATTGQATDISPGPYGSAPMGFARRGNHVLFLAYDDTDEWQLWAIPASLSCPPGLTVGKGPSVER